MVLVLSSCHGDGSFVAAKYNRNEDRAMGVPIDRNKVLSG